MNNGKDIKFNDATQELDDIINAIQNERIDVDNLTQKVKRAVGLIKLCKGKIQQTEIEIKNIVEDLETPNREKKDMGSDLSQENDIDLSDEALGESI